MKNSETYKENREKLKELSQAVKPLVKEGVYNTVNEAIISEFYKSENPEIKVLNTFGQWKNAGKTILKGSKAFLCWGQPVSRKKKEESQPEEKDEYSFFPLCYLFSNLQVK